jgi:thiosulfate/3-mercaptopyruvate sulfurtransferase
VFVDARSPAEFSGEEAGEGVKRPGHIPGAANIPWASHIVGAENPVLRSPDEILSLYDGLGISPEDRVISYCRTGRTSSMSYFALKYLGFDVRLFDGSFTEWSADPETPVETSETSP